MRHVHFANEGLIDLRAIKTFGASSKEGKNPIGYFGTGLKYAIAIALRIGCKVTIWRGLDKYTFHAQPTKIRVDDFDLVCMEGPEEGQIEELAFTTELGKNWDAWQAFRELWCNALDEGGTVFAGPVTEPDEGRTLVQVEGEAFVDCYNHRDEIMLMGTPKWFADGVEIHHKNSSRGYFRNVRVHTLDRPAILTYNVVGRSLDLTEDRTLKYSFQFENAVVNALAKTDDDRLLEILMDAHRESWESHLDFGDVEPGPALLSMLEETDFKNVHNHSLHRMYLKQKGHAMRPKVVNVDSNEKIQLRRALEFLSCLGYDEIEKYTINVTDELEDEVLGRAYDGEIWLNRRTFMRGTKLVAGTLLEEYIHLHHGLQDCTRSLQDFFLDALITMGEKFRGEPL